jgi:hypothetical protein
MTTKINLDGPEARTLGYHIAAFLETAGRQVVYSPDRKELIVGEHGAAPGESGEHVEGHRGGFVTPRTYPAIGER